MLSCDVNAAYDPLFADAFEEKNAAFAGRGMTFSKYTGSKGKISSNDANAEYIAWIRTIMDNAKVHYQFAEMGKVDRGGGELSHISCHILACRSSTAGFACSICMLPWEVTSKADIYETKKGYEAFLKRM